MNEWSSGFVYAFGFQFWLTFYCDNIMSERETRMKNNWLWFWTVHQNWRLKNDYSKLMQRNNHTRLLCENSNQIPKLKLRHQITKADFSTMCDVIIVISSSLLPSPIIWFCLTEAAAIMNGGMIICDFSISLCIFESLSNEYESFTIQILRIIWCRVG